MPRRQRTAVERAQQAKRESKGLDFKECFDPSSDADWAELVKDFMAMANTGGGVIVVGVCNDGSPAQEDVDPVLALDLAKITDKVERWGLKAGARGAFGRCAECAAEACWCHAMGCSRAKA